MRNSSRHIHFQTSWNDHREIDSRIWSKSNKSRQLKIKKFFELRKHIKKNCIFKYQAITLHMYYGEGGSTMYVLKWTHPAILILEYRFWRLCLRVFNLIAWDTHGKNWLILVTNVPLIKIIWKWRNHKFSFINICSNFQNLNVDGRPHYS